MENAEKSIRTYVMTSDLAVSTKSMSNTCIVRNCRIQGVERKLTKTKTDPY
jgi:hypothetical protein